MNQVTFFNKVEMMQKLNDAASLLSKNENTKRTHLALMLGIMASRPKEFDENCQVNINWIGTTFREYISNIQNLNDRELDIVIAIVYRFCTEYDMSVPNNVSMEMLSFLGWVRDEAANFQDEAQVHIRFVQQDMSIAMLKQLFNSKEIGNLRQISSVASTTEQKINGWENRLSEAESKATRLAETFEKHTQAFNFVGLHQGFESLYQSISGDLIIARRSMIFFGFLVLIPSGIDIWALINGFDLSKINVYTFIAGGISTVTLTLLFLYFFRIALRKADSCNAQLLQVKLRMSLCQFIQSYADYSTEIKAKNGDALAKFEALIFSGIVSAEDKLPSTFDGLDQLSMLIKSIRGSKN